MIKLFAYINILAIFFGLASLSLTICIFIRNKNLLLRKYIPIQTILLIRQVLYILRMDSNIFTFPNWGLKLFLSLDCIALFLLIYYMSRIIKFHFNLSLRKYFLPVIIFSGIYYLYGVILILLKGIPEVFVFLPSILWTIIPISIILYLGIIILIKSHHLKSKIIAIMLLFFTILILFYDLEIIPRLHILGLSLFPLFLFSLSFVSILLLTRIFIITDGKNLNKDKLFLEKKYGLSPRENEIAHKIADGKTYSEVGEELFISLGTVKSHVFKIYRKIGITNKVALIQIMKKYD